MGKFCSSRQHSLLPLRVRRHDRRFVGYRGVDEDVCRNTPHIFFTQRAVRFSSPNIARHRSTIYRVDHFVGGVLHQILQIGLRIQGKISRPDEEIQHLCQEILSKIIPRLLRPLDGDINTSTDVATNLPVIYDATCVYAHNECKSTYRFPCLQSQHLYAIELDGKEFADANFVSGIGTSPSCTT